MHASSQPVGANPDLELMQALAHCAPEQHLHLIDLPYRLSSWALDRAENLRLWRGADGQLLAWAVLQAPFWAIDVALHPAADAALYSEALTWAVARARALADDPDYGRPCWFVSVPAEQSERRAALEAQGFADQAQVPVDPWSKVLLTRPARGPVWERSLPPGYRLRALGGRAEAGAYVALHRAVFQSTSMTVGWRERTLARAQYRPELDLVIEAPDGSLAGFCIGWFDPAGFGGLPSGQIEPLGVAAGQRGLGLGRGLLEACCARLADAGAEHIYVETDRQREAALGVYGAAGFRILHDVCVYRLDL